MPWVSRIQKNLTSYLTRKIWYLLLRDYWLILPKFNFWKGTRHGLHSTLRFFLIFPNSRQVIYQAGHILDLCCVWLFNTAPFCENYTKVYFDAKLLEKGLNRAAWGGDGGWLKFLVSNFPFFIKKSPFWPISGHALNF